MMDALSILNDHNQISGGSKELVQLDNTQRLNKAESFSSALFKKLVTS